MDLRKLAAGLPTSMACSPEAHAERPSIRPEAAAMLSRKAADKMNRFPR